MRPEIRSAPAATAGLTLAAGALLVAAAGSAAQETATGPEFQAFVGTYLIQDPGPAPDEPPPEIRNAPVLGARIAYHTPLRFFVQGEFGYAPTRLTREGVRGDVDITVFGGSVGYDIPLSPEATLFLVSGAAANRWNTAGLEPEVDLDVNFGVGTRIALSPSLSVRVELRDHYMKDGYSATRRRLTPGLGPEPSRTSIHTVELSGGLSFFPGGGPDSDGDGVADGRDLCPGTPPGEPVDERGCPLDSDRDGVPDAEDRCPDTPRGTVADERGCPTDGDGDGVPDGLDRCPDTVEGAHVDEAGCALDWDGDGVPNGIDRCPDTPFGVAVGEDGCPESPLERSLLEDGRAVLEEVSFEPGTTSLLEGFRAALDALGEILARRPGLRVEIQAHSDAVGDAAANESITQGRAEVVRDYLLSAFPDIDPGRLTARGYGEARPIASNRTPEGRETNRRVEIVVAEEEGGVPERP